MKLTEKTGKIVSTLAVHDDDGVMVITHQGVLIRCQVDSIRNMGRATQGVKFIKLDENDHVATCARIIEKEDEEGVEEAAAEEMPLDAEVIEETDASAEDTE